MTTPDHVLKDARWLRENYDEQRSAQFMASKRVRAICDALLAQQPQGITASTTGAAQGLARTMLEIQERRAKR